MTELTRKLFRIPRRQPLRSIEWIWTIGPRLAEFSFGGSRKRDFSLPSSGKSKSLIYDGDAWSFEEAELKTEVECRPSQIPRERAEEITTRIYYPLSLETSLG